MSRFETVGKFGCVTDSSTFERGSVEESVSVMSGSGAKESAKAERRANIV